MSADPKRRNHNQYVETIKENILRDAEVVVNEFPLMHVQGTPFDQGISPMDDDEMQRVDLAASRRSFKLDAGARDLSLDPKKSQLKQEHILKRAMPLKTASMWTALIHASMWYHCIHQKYRHQRLRNKLERYLLPTLLHRRLKGLLGAGTEPPAATEAARGEPSGGGDATSVIEQPTGAVLVQCCPWIAALQDVDFADEVANGMQKISKIIGDDVVKGGDGAQGVFYIALSGRYEWMPPSSNVFSTSVAASIPPAQQQAEKVNAPFAFGDPFGGPSRYLRTLIARSKGAVWYISKSSVDSILNGWIKHRTKDLYFAEVKKEMVASLRINFPLEPHRIPLLRKMPSDLVRSYFPSFEPVVLDKGTSLFEDGASGSAVYLVCDGIINRTKKTTGDDAGFSQFITVRPNTMPPQHQQAFALSLSSSSAGTGRYAFFGEEPHILPEKHRCTCTVYSDVLIGYLVPQPIFTSMLLDDPRLLLQLRDDILLQRAKMMRIKAEALRQVPMLHEFPLQRLHTLVQVMTPRVVERSQYICQSQQAMRDIFLVIRGDVRDPRQPGAVPSVLPPPKGTSSVAPAGQGTLGVSAAASFALKEGSKERGDDCALVGERSTGMVERTTSFTGAGEKSLQRFSSIAKTLGAASVTSAAFTRKASSMVQQTIGSGLPNEVALVEEHDLNPPIPMGLATTIQCALGGGWEGLLQEKWPRTWEAMSVVEVWVLPTAAIRAEYNELARGPQATLLHLMRVNQMKEQGLEEVPNTKLPSMSFYRSGGPVIHSGSESLSDTTKRSSFRRRNRSRVSMKLSSTSAVHGGHGVNDSDSQHDDTSVGEGSVTADSARGARANVRHPQHVTQRDDAAVGDNSPSAKSNSHRSPSKPKKPSPLKPRAPRKHPSTRANARSTKGAAPPNDAAPPAPQAVNSEAAAEIALMRKLAQERNARQQMLRLLPLEEVIRHETQRLKRGEHKYTALPPLSSREDQLYFHNEPPPATPEEEAGERSATARSSPLSDAIPIERMQGLYSGTQRMDPDTGVMESDRVIREAPAPLAASARLPPRRAAKPSANTGSAFDSDFWSQSWSPLPPGLQMMVSQDAKLLRGDKDKKGGTTSPKKSRVAVAVDGAAHEGGRRRWFQSVPRIAPPVKCSSLDQNYHGSEAFDVLLLQTLRSADAAGALKQPNMLSPSPRRM